MTAGLPVRRTLVCEIRSCARSSMFVLLGAAALLTGCGDGGEDTAAVAAQTPTPAPTPTPTPSPAPTTASTEQPNHSPTIAGLPLGAVMVGTQYSFTPTAADADGDILTFSISYRAP